MKFSKKIVRVIEDELGTKLSEKSIKKGEFSSIYSDGLHGECLVHITMYNKKTVMVSASKKGEKARYLDGMFSTRELKKVLRKV